MAFKFDKLWELLEQRGMTKEQLRVAIRASQTTIVKMAANENVSLEVIDRICAFLKCSADDVMEFEAAKQPVFKERGQITKGSVYMCAIPIGEEVNGRAATRKQPALVIQATELCKGHPFVYIAPLSSRVLQSNTFSITVKGSEQNGLPQNQVSIMLSQIRQLRTVLLSERLGILEPEYMAQVDQMLKTIFGLHVGSFQ